MSFYAIVKFPDEKDAVRGVPDSWVSENINNPENSQCRWPDTKYERILMSLITNRSEPEDDWRTIRCKVRKP